MDNTPPTPTPVGNQPSFTNTPNSSSPIPPTFQPTPTSPAAAPKSRSTNTIIIVAIASAVLIGLIALLFVIFNRKVDYVATYDALEPLDSSLSDLTYHNCYDVNNYYDDPYVSSSEYQQYISGCLTEFATVATNVQEFAKTSGAKHDPEIKQAFDTFETTFNSIYTKESDLRSQLSLYNTYHEFYLIIENAGPDHNLEQSITSAADLFQNTKNPTLMTFASGFRERGLAYARAIENYNRSNSYSSALYSEVRSTMNALTEYIETSAPEVYDVSGLDFTQLNSLEDTYYKLDTVVRDAYYVHL